MKIIIIMSVFHWAHSLLSPTLVFHQEWHEFKVNYRRSFETESEETHRREIFLRNKYLVAKHNEKYGKGETFHKLELNKYGDWESEEINRILNGYNRMNRIHNDNTLPPVQGNKFKPPLLLRVPDYVNWTEAGGVGPVKDQGCCGSGYAFSALGAVEGQIFIWNKTLPTFSAQNIIDCSLKQGNQGCDGGLHTAAFQYIKEMGGVNKEGEYHYKGEKGDCRFDPKTAEGNISAIEFVESGNEEHLKLAVASVGPLSVAIDASSISFQFYRSGVFHDPKCNPQKLVHGVLLVGYGTDLETNKDFWLIKNSWGTEWGENGYMKLERNANNMCGVATRAYYPKL